MKACLKGDRHTPEIILDFAGSGFSADEIIKQIATRIHENSMIHTLIIENAVLSEKGASALRQAVLGHRTLRTLALLKLTISSYRKVVSGPEADYYFPKDLDATVDQLSAILRDARLHTIELTEVNFVDNTERHFEHIDMVDPVSMRDILLQEKEPFYIKEIAASLNHNPHLYRLNFSMAGVDVNELVEEIEQNIRRRHASEELNQVLEGTHAAIETHWFPEIFKIFAWKLWWHSQLRKKHW